VQVGQDRLPVDVQQLAVFVHRAEHQGLPALLQPHDQQDVEPLALPDEPEAHVPQVHDKPHAAPPLVQPQHGRVVVAGHE